MENYKKYNTLTFLTLMCLTGNVLKKIVLQDVSASEFTILIKKSSKETNYL